MIKFSRIEQYKEKAAIALEFQEMVKTSGWQRLENIISTEVDKAKNMLLEMANLDSIELKKIQMEGRAFQRILRIVYETIKQGKEAQEKITKINQIRQGGRFIR